MAPVTLTDEQIRAIADGEEAPEMEGRDLPRVQAGGDVQAGEGVAERVGRDVGARGGAGRAPDAGGPDAPVGDVGYQAPAVPLELPKVIAQADDDGHGSHAARLRRLLSTPVAGGGADYERVLADVAAPEGPHLPGTEAGVGHEADDGAVPWLGHGGPDPFYLDDRGRTATGRLTRELLEAAARVRRDQVIVHRCPECGAEDGDGAIGHVGRLPRAKELRAPVADVGAADLPEPQLAEVGDDEAVAVVAPVVDGAWLPGGSVGTDPLVEPVLKREPLDARRAGAAQEIPEEDLGLAAGGESLGAPSSSLRPVHAPRLARALRFFSKGRH